MKAHDVGSLLAGIGELEFREIAAFNRGSVGLFRTTAGASPWERHPDDDELLHVLEGEVDLEVRTESSSVTTTLRAGSVFVVPRGLWHRHVVRERLTELYVTPGATEHSHADDPLAKR